MFRERARTLRAVSLGVDAVCISVGFGAALVLRVFHELIRGLGTLIAAKPWVRENVVCEGYAERKRTAA